MPGQIASAWHMGQESMMKVLGKSPRDIGLDQIWDVAHNIAKIEEHDR